MGYGLKSSPRDSTRILNTNTATIAGKFALDAVQANPNISGTLGYLIQSLNTTVATFTLLQLSGTTVPK